MADDKKQLLDFNIRLPKCGLNKRYRLATSIVQQKSLPAQPVHFWFRTRYISTTGTAISAHHPHVLRLRVPRPPLLLRLLDLCFRYLPSLAQSYIRNFFPEWFLPDSVIIKSQKGEGEGEEKRDPEIVQELFDTEVEAYSRLGPVQGVWVPRCYGQIWYGGTRALLLEELGGVSLASPQGAMLRLEELSEMLQECHGVLHSFGIHQSDHQVGNYQLLLDGRRLAALDFERAEFDHSENDNAFFMTCHIEQLARNYLNLQLHFEHEGRLEVVPT